MSINKSERASIRLRDDVQNMADRLAMFDELVKAVEKLHGGLSMHVTSKNDPSAAVLREYAHLLSKAWELQK